MTDPSFTNEADRDLLVVLLTRADAEEAASRLLAAGVAPEDVEVDHDTDRVTSLRAEMHEELAHAWAVPNARAVYPKEAARLVLGGLVGLVIGVATAFPFALIEIGDTTYAARLAVLLLVGAAFGVAIGMVVGPAFGSIRADQSPAAERGTLLRVHHDTLELRQLLAGFHPLRMDEIRRDDDLPINAVADPDRGGQRDSGHESL